MSTFIRRFLTDPGEEVLLEIESVNILDLDPPASITGVGAGTVSIVGEFENGPFAEPTEVSGASDLLSTFGSLGYDQAGVAANNPCARSRKADGAPLAEAWNGNGFVQLSGKKFRRLIIVRVDTSVGIVDFRREAFLTSSNSDGYFDLEPGQILALDIGAGSVSATFSATAGTRTGVAGTYATTFAGGETLTLGYDDAADFTTTFLAADQSAAQVASRINLYAGFTFADTNGGQLRITGVKRGTAGQVRVIAASAGVLAILGLTVLTTAGTGNVANIDSVTPAEVETVVEAAVAGTRVEVQSDGKLRITRTYATATDTITVAVATTALNLGFAVAAAGANATGLAGVIPAGTVLNNVGGTNAFVTMQDIVITASNAGPYSVKVRHALDDGTGLSANAATIVKCTTPIPMGSFGVTNAALLSAALTEAAIDAAYVTAFDSTIDINTIAREINVIYSARQSNQVRKSIRQNVLTASADGCFGRIGVVRPPLNTTKTAAKSTTAEPGVGAYRDQRVIYCYPGANTFVPLIAKRGTAGGASFTSDGNVDVGADGFLASCCSQLAPEENPGQETTFTAAVNGIESGANVQGFTITDYTAFKAKGICALRIDEGKAIFQSGVTSVDPGTYPQLVNIARRRMADFVQDTLARRGKGYGKKLSTFARRKALAGEIRMFLRGLLSPNKPENQRIAGFTVDIKSGNTKTSLGKGLYRIIIKIRTLASLDSIVLETTIGEQVEVEEVFEQAA
jgi:hypothetical protein